MKRREIEDTITQVGIATSLINGSMSLLNPKTGENIEVDMNSTLAIVRGTIAWVDTLFMDGAEQEPSMFKNMHNLLSMVGASIAREISSDEEE